MSQTSEEDFEFIWKIENFSMCPLQERQILKSPIFVVDTWKRRKLELRLFPRGNGSPEYISCYAAIIDYDDELNGASVTCSISVIGSTISSIKTEDEEHIFKKGYMYGHQELVARDKILKENNVYLPNDTLTIRYQLLIIDKESKSTTAFDLGDKSTVADEILMSAAKYELEELKKQFSSNECSAVTHIGVGKVSVVWPIKGIRGLGINRKVSIPVVSALYGDPSFVLTLYFSEETAEDPSANIEIRRKESDYSKNIFVKCKITVFNSIRDLKFDNEGEYLFKAYEEDHIWNFPFSRRKSELLRLMNSNDDALYLRCEFAYSRDGDTYNIRSEDLMRLKYENNSDTKNLIELSDELKDLYDRGIMSDVTIRVGNDSLTAHRNILSTRSPVFRSIFENDAKEKDPGFVDISDVDLDTLDQMFAFLYSGKLDLSGTEEAVKLYKAADKYQVIALKKKCSLFLQSVVSVSNVCLILNLADLHQDGDLMDVTKDFVSRNKNEVFESECWKKLMEKNARLCASIMFETFSGNKI